MNAAFARLSWLRRRNPSRCCQIAVVEFVVLGLVVAIPCRNRIVSRGRIENMPIENEHMPPRCRCHAQRQKFERACDHHGRQDACEIGHQQRDCTQHLNLRSRAQQPGELLTVGHGCIARLSQAGRAHSVPCGLLRVCGDFPGKTHAQPNRHTDERDDSESGFGVRALRRHERDRRCVVVGSPNNQRGHPHHGGSQEPGCGGPDLTKRPIRDSRSRSHTVQFCSQIVTMRTLLV